MMLYTVLGPATGMIEVEVDGRKVTRTIYDKYGYVWRLSPVFIDLGKVEDVHNVKITVSPDKFDKRGMLAKLGKEAKFDQNPDSFNPTDLVIGGICIEGGTITN